MVEAEVLVIGSGVAGLTYALKVAEFARVLLITKKEHTESNTNYAQGGIAAVMAPDDAPELHIEDTLVCGAGLCHRDAVEQLVREGPERVRELIEWGARFTSERTVEGREELALGREGGHSRRRIVHAKDLTGREVERTLVTAVQEHPRIQVLEHHLAIDLIMEDVPGAHCPAPGGRDAGESAGMDSSTELGTGHRAPGTAAGTVAGACVLDTLGGEVKTFRARAVALATGGCGQVYLHTTNPRIATGDGVAMAYRAGARVANMEFIQFHPTTLYHPEGRSFLISEAVRGEGAVLRLRDGSPFMEKYHPMGPLAPRDVVARAIDQELKQSGDDYVLLDLTHLEPEEVRARFPNIYSRCLEFGIDITREPIPIVPAAHYSCGGVLTDLEGRSSLGRLYVVGEAACTGVHGANRLASNSLLEALVFAHHAAEDTRRLLARDRDAGADTEGPCEVANDPRRASNEVSPEFVQLLRQLLQTLMWTHVGIVRSDRRLRQALREVTLLHDAVEKLFQSAQITEGTIELRNIALVAQLIIRSALRRKESRGLNTNVDHPDRDDLHAAVDTVLVREAGGR